MGNEFGTKSSLDNLCGYCGHALKFHYRPDGKPMACDVETNYKSWPGGIKVDSEGPCGCEEAFS